MQQVFSTVEKLRDADANILILGENGTGKDVIARMLYRNSPRYGKPFVTIDLGSIPEQLFESELFGYEKGLHRCTESESWTYGSGNRRYAFSGRDR